VIKCGTCLVSRVVDQLRCALKAKNAIIQQLEEEKRDAVSEASHQFEMKIAELNDKLRAFETAAANVSSSHYCSVNIFNKLIQLLSCFPFCCNLYGVIYAVHIYVDMFVASSCLKLIL